MNAMNYVCGFAFPHAAPDFVWLIRKKKPEWQAGKLNGISGKIEGRESAVEAMVREFKEEAGLFIPADRWFRFSILDAMTPNGEIVGRVHFFRTVLALGELPETKTDEELVYTRAEHLPSDVIPNLRFLIPMARHDGLSTVYPSHIWELAA